MNSSGIDKIMLGLSAIGIIVTVYLIIYHYANIPLLCPNNGLIDCQNVLNSQYSVVFGVPLPVIGLLFFMIEILSIRMRYKEILVFFNAVSFAFIIYLIYLETVLGAICIYCTAVHLLVVALFALSLYKAMKLS